MFLLFLYPVFSERNHLNRKWEESPSNGAQAAIKAFELTNCATLSPKPKGGSVKNPRSEQAIMQNQHILLIFHKFWHIRDMQVSYIKVTKHSKCMYARHTVYIHIYQWSTRSNWDHFTHPCTRNTQGYVVVELMGHSQKSPYKQEEQPPALIRAP